jgi:hypothetical protein
MKVPFFLIVNKKGSVRVNKTPPALGFDEISISLDLELPDSLFKKPLLSATIKVKESDVKPRVISPEIKNNIEEAIKQHSGVEVKLTISES